MATASTAKEIDTSELRIHLVHIRLDIAIRDPLVDRPELLNQRPGLNPCLVQASRLISLTYMTGSGCPGAYLSSGRDLATRMGFDRVLPYASTPPHFT